jgi:hypothetical protein
MFNDNEINIERRDIVIIGTGNEFDSDRLKHLGSVIMNNSFIHVWHVFERE